MSRAMCRTVLVLALAVLAAAAPFEYRSYANITAELHGLAKRYPGLLRVYSAQREFGVEHTGGTCKELLPDGSLAARTCTVWVAELGKRPAAGAAAADTRPEMLVSGELHGDEVVGPQAAVAFLRFMLQRYKTDAYVRHMVDSRVVTVVPTANAIGYETGRREELYQRPGLPKAMFDPNRDFAFNTDPRGCMRTVAARVFNELFRRRLFRVLVTFHGGTNVLSYEWGDRVHCRGRRCGRAPDLAIMRALAERMAAHAGPAGKFEPAYPVGTMGRLVYPVNGGMEDWAYGASWAGQGVRCTPKTYGGYPLQKTVYTTDMTRCLTLLVETGLSKQPSPKTLGDSKDMLVRGAPGDGHVPRNVRLLLSAVDALEPYIVMPEKSRVSFSSATDRRVRMSWRIGGAFVVDGTYLQWSTSAGVHGVTRVQKGKGGSHALGNATVFEDVIEFNTEKIPLSTRVYVRVAAVVDNSLDKKVKGASPNMLPQSHLQHARSHFDSTRRIGNRYINCRRVIFSKTMRVESRESHVRVVADRSMQWGLGAGKLRAPSDKATASALYPPAWSLSVPVWELILAGVFFILFPALIFLLCVCCKNESGNEEDPEVKKELLVEDLLDDEDE